jgi:hypothetical protein
VIQQRRCDTAWSDALAHRDQCKPMPRSAHALRSGKRLLQRHSAELGAGAFAAAWFAYLGYGPTLEVTNIRWMLRDDWAAYLWGFSFFRHAEWSWPLGNTPELFWPFGTSVGFTDANPWASVFFKLLSPALPPDFQFSGPWFLLCFVLYAVLGARIGAVFTEDKVRQALSGALFAVSPLLPSRHPHIALCAFFFVAAGVHLNLAPVRSRSDGLRLVRRACVWLAWAAGTHGYLSVMLLVLSAAACVRLGAVERVLGAWEASLAMASFVAITLGVYLLFGYVGWRPTELTAEGFGQFSGDLTALVNPMGWSRFLPGLPVMPRQWEGFSYLGLGVLSLLALRALLGARAPSGVLAAARRQWPLLIAVLVMWLYSWSSHVAYRGVTVLDLSELYEPFARLTGIFRSSGRFSWPLHVALVTAAISAAAALENAHLGRAVLLAAVLVQAAELDATRLDFRDVALHPLEHPAWAESEASYRHLALVPLHLLWVCRYDHALVNRLSYEAYRRRWTFNSGNFMRKQAGVEALCDAPLRPAPETIYVLGDRRPARILEAAGFACGRLDGLGVCVPGHEPTPLLAAIRESPL